MHCCVLHYHGNTFKFLLKGQLSTSTAAHFITKSITAHNSVSHMQDFHCKEVAVITKECVSTILVIVIQATVDLTASMYYCVSISNHVTKRLIEL